MILLKKWVTLFVLFQTCNPSKFSINLQLKRKKIKNPYFILLKKRNIVYKLATLKGVLVTVNWEQKNKHPEKKPKNYSHAI